MFRSMRINLIYFLNRWRKRQAVFTLTVHFRVHARWDVLVQLGHQGEFSLVGQEKSTSDTNGGREAPRLCGKICHYSLPFLDRLVDWLERHGNNKERPRW